jgi:hypothetical protein
MIDSTRLTPAQMAVVRQMRAGSMDESQIHPGTLDSLKRKGIIERPSQSGWPGRWNGRPVILTDKGLAVQTKGQADGDH